MKRSKKRWLKMIALLLGLAPRAYAEPIVFPDDEPMGREASVVISDDTAAVRLGEHPSASVAESPRQPAVQRSQYLITPDQVMGAPQPAFAGAMTPDDVNIGFASTSSLDRILWRVGNTSMDQYGINGGYTTLNGFVPVIVESDRALIWMNPRVSITDYGDGVVNIGVGRRIYSADDDRVYGASFWWDYDTGHVGDYHQFGGSFESLGRYFSLRGNFAIPFGSTTTDVGIISGNPIFVGNQLTLPQTILSEQAYQVYDIEASVPFPGLGRYGADLAAGFYYLNGSETDSNAGVSVRAQAQITEDFWINGLYTYDGIFNSNFSLNMELTIPDGAPSQWFRRRPVSSMMTASVMRKYRVPVNTVSSTGSITLAAPNGTPFNIAVIDPNYVPPVGVTPDGSFTNPFPSVEDYMALTPIERASFNLIYVRRRDDLTDTNLNTTIALLDQQQLFGDGQFADGTRPTITTNAGVFELPGTAGDFPILSNSAAIGMNVITLANGNEVGGFQIGAGGTADGIVGVGIDGFNLHDLIIGEFSGVVNGINITSDTSIATGYSLENTGIIRDNVITGSGFNSNTGISLTHTAGDLDLYIGATPTAANPTATQVVSNFLGEDADNSGTLSASEDNDGDGILDRGIGISVTATGGTINGYSTAADEGFGFQYNQTTGNGTGMVLATDGGGVVNASFFNNNFSNNTDEDGAGLEVRADGGDITLSTVESNVMSGNAGDGAMLVAANGGTLIIPEFEDEDGDGVLDPGEDLNLNSQLDRGFILNTANNNGGNGIRVVADAGTANVAFAGNTLNGNTLNGIAFQADNGGTINVDQFLTNTITSNLEASIFVTGTGGTINLGTIEDQIFDRTTNGTAGILFDTSDVAITGIIQNNQFLGSSANTNLSIGLGGEVRGGSLDLTIVNNLFENSVGAGIGFILGESDTRPAPGTGTPLAGDAVEARLIITDNTIVGTTAGTDPDFNGSGIIIELEGQESDTGVPPTDPTTTVQPSAILEGLIAENFLGIRPDEVSLLTTDISAITLADGNAGAGIEIRVGGDTAITDLASVGSLIDDPALDGLHIGAITYGGRDYVGNVMVNNDEGIRVRRSDSSTIDNFNINGNVIQNNLNDGIDIQATNDGVAFGVEEILNFSVVDNYIVGNGFQTDGTQGATGRGIQIRAEGAAVIDIDIEDNFIDANRMSGIEARTQTDSHFWLDDGSFTLRDPVLHAAGGEDGIIFGDWVGNTITNNGYLDPNGPSQPGILDVLVEGHGISLGRIDFPDLDSSLGYVEGFNNGGLSDTTVLNIADNYIAGNAEDGVHVYLDKQQIFSTAAGENRTTRINITGNDIVDNGEDGINVHNPTVSFAIVNADNNLITGNGQYSGQRSVTTDGGNQTMNIIGDGIEVVTSNIATTVFSASNNRIKENDGRGVNVLSNFGGFATFSFLDNNISSNSREGFYVHNSDLFNQVTTLTGITAGTVRTGYSDDIAPGAQPAWMADMDGNHEVYNYGKSGGFFEAGNDPTPAVLPFLPDYEPSIPPASAVTDLVLLRNNINNNGSVQPDPDGEEPYTTLGGLVIRIGSAATDASIPSVPIPFLTSGVRALVMDNRMSGNIGRDVFFDGFVSTEPPTVDNLPDPLVRFDLVFENNRGNSIDVSGDNFVVFYTNDAPTDLNGDNVKRPDPPYTNQNVPRDATRNLGLDPNGLLLPGFGSSTLRIEVGGAALNGSGVFLGNNIFNNIYSDFQPDTGLILGGQWQHVPDGTLLPVPPFPPY